MFFKTSPDWEARPFILAGVAGSLGACPLRHGVQGRDPPRTDASPLQNTHMYNLKMPINTTMVGNLHNKGEHAHVTHTEKIHPPSYGGVR